MADSYAAQQMFQTRLNNNTYTDRFCVCGVILPKNLPRCSHCSFNDSLKMTVIYKNNAKYGGYAKAVRQLHMMRTRKSKFTDRSTDKETTSTTHK